LNGPRRAPATRWHFASRTSAPNADAQRDAERARWAPTLPCLRNHGRAGAAPSVHRSTRSPCAGVYGIDEVSGIQSHTVARCRRRPPSEAKRRSILARARPSWPADAEGMLRANRHGRGAVGLQLARRAPKVLPARLSVISSPRCCSDRGPSSVAEGVGRRRVVSVRASTGLPEMRVFRPATAAEPFSPAR